MTTHISEELPARKHAPAAAPAAKGKDAKPAAKDGKPEAGKTEENSEKRIRQAVYDIRYRARREDIDLKAAFSQYMANTSMSAGERAAVREKLFGKDGSSVKEQFMVGTDEMVEASLATAMYKVFVEGSKKEVPQVEESLDAEKGKYKVRVTDKNGRTYVRYADRAKITQLRSNPNIKSVELTDYGEPYEGEKKKGEQTADAKAGKDYDGDGKVESSSKEHAGVVHNAIQRAKGGKEDGKDTRKEQFEITEGKKKDSKKKKKAKVKRWWDDDGDGVGYEDHEVSEGTDSYEAKGGKKVTGSNVDNYSTGVVQVNPDDGGKNGPKSIRNLVAHNEIDLASSQMRFMEILHERKLSKKEEKKKEKYVKGMKDKKDEFEDRYGEDGESVMYATATKMAKKKKKKKEKNVAEAATCPKCGHCPCECDKKDGRDMKTRVSLMKNKLRAMGMKNPMMLDLPDEDKVMKVMTSSSAKQVEEGAGLVTGTAKAINTVLKPAGQTKEQGDEAVRRLTRTIDKVAKPVKGAIQAGSKALLGDKPITAGGGTPDTQKADQEARRLGQNRMRQAGY